MDPEFRQKSDKFRHYPLTNKPSFKVIQISEDSYNFFRDFASRPQQNIFRQGYWKNWGRMTCDQRLEAWLNIICIEQNGKTFTYEIFED